MEDYLNLNCFVCMKFRYLIFLIIEELCIVKNNLIIAKYETECSVKIKYKYKMDKVVADISKIIYLFLRLYVNSLGRYSIRMFALNF
ncbi:hypothetical protein [Fonticella tunisiensis]|uniref:Uncharacterized protein n=1 Tax=Fonticella tunisiensis TaxID=1096341 RepID=A0A4R7K3Z1_9CLOT|nr:hypothetical protein [Fonticella tunisiensis]TDT45630.1 hypothetical protein EDD71_1623 [Fonticella tunisiensis]